MWKGLNKVGDVKKEIRMQNKDNFILLFYRVGRVVVVLVPTGTQSSQ